MRAVLIPTAPCVVHAQSTPPTLADLVARAAAQSPIVLLSRLAADSAGAELRIARQRPNPEFQGVQNTPYQYSVSLQLDAGPARTARISAARAALAAARADTADASRIVRSLVRQAFYDLLLAGAQRDLAGRSRDVYRQLADADSVRLIAGDVPERNVVKSRLEFARAEAALEQAAAGVRATRVALQALIGIPAPDTGFTVKGTLDYRPASAWNTLDSAPAIARDSRPDAQAAATRVEQSRALQLLAARLWIPIPQVSIVAQQNKRAFEPDVPYTLGNGRAAFGLAFPVPLLSRYDGEKERAKAGTSSAIVNASRTSIAIAGEVTGAIDAARATRALVERYEGGLLQQAQTALDQARYAYRAGAISLLDLLDAVRTYDGTFGNRIQALHDYWIAVSAVNRAVGRDLLPQ